MSPEEIANLLKSRFGDNITGQNLEAIDPWIAVAPEAVHEVCLFLRDEPRLGFDFLHCISAVDYCEPDPKKAKKAEFEPHLELLYHLSSLAHGHKIVLKVFLPRWKDDVPGRLPEVSSVADIWPTANWHEREVYDLSGIWFLGHPNLRRILCPEDWVGHPLRKDYEFPDEYHGIRAR
jgi:NADH-quinone oxidoreductase subunit C